MRHNQEAPPDCSLVQDLVVFFGMESSAVKHLADAGHPYLQRDADSADTELIIGAGSTNANDPDTAS